MSWRFNFVSLGPSIASAGKYDYVPLIVLTRAAIMRASHTLLVSLDRCVCGALRLTPLLHDMGCGRLTQACCVFLSAAVALFLAISSSMAFIFS